MTREIEFRGLDLKGKWHYGDFLCDPNGCRICYSVDIPPCMSDPGGDTRFFQEHVDFKTIGQFTGILDCNNNRIYIGDIINQSIDAWVSGHPVNGDDEHFHGYAQGEVVFHRRHGVCLKKPFIWDDDTDELNRISKGYITISSRRSGIVGNIHQNSELLKPKQNS